MPQDGWPSEPQDARPEAPARAALGIAGKLGPRDGQRLRRTACVPPGVRRIQQKPGAQRQDDTRLTILPTFVDDVTNLLPVKFVKITFPVACERRALSREVPCVSR